MMQKILKGDTSGQVSLALADGFDYTDATVEVIYQGAVRQFKNCAAGQTIQFSFTAAETATMALGVFPVTVRIGKPDGTLITVANAGVKIAVTDCIGEVRAGSVIAVDAHGGLYGVDDLPANYTIKDLRAKINEIITKLGGGVAALCLLACTAFGAGVTLQNAALEDIPNGASVVTNATIDFSGLAIIDMTDLATVSQLNTATDTVLKAANEYAEGCACGITTNDVGAIIASSNLATVASLNKKINGLTATNIVDGILAASNYVTQTTLAAATNAVEYLYGTNGNERVNAYGELQRVGMGGNYFENSGGKRYSYEGFDGARYTWTNTPTERIIYRKSDGWKLYNKGSETGVMYGRDDAPGLDPTQVGVSLSTAFFYGVAGSSDVSVYGFHPTTDRHWPTPYDRFARASELASAGVDAQTVTGIVESASVTNAGAVASAVSQVVRTNGTITVADDFCLSGVNNDPFIRREANYGGGDMSWRFLGESTSSVHAYLADGVDGNIPWYQVSERPSTVNGYAAWTNDVLYRVGDVVEIRTDRQGAGLFVCNYEHTSAYVYPVVDDDRGQVTPNMSYWDEVLSKGTAYTKDEVDTKLKFASNIAYQYWDPTAFYMVGEGVLHEYVGDDTLFTNVYICLAPTATVGTFVASEWSNLGTQPLQTIAADTTALKTSKQGALYTTSVAPPIVMAGANGPRLTTSGEVTVTNAVSSRVLTAVTASATDADLATARAMWTLFAALSNRIDQLEAAVNAANADLEDALGGND